MFSADNMLQADNTQCYQLKTQNIVTANIRKHKTLQADNILSTYRIMFY
jgi:hypothetical protein